MPLPAISKPYTFPSGSPVDPAQANADFDTVYSAVNALRASTVYDAIDYGATGNGTTDDAPAINNAIAAASAAGGGIVFLAAGTFLLGSSGIVHHPGVRLIGSGIDTTILRQGSGLNAAYVVDMLSQSPANATLEDLTVDCNYTQNRSSAIVVAIGSAGPTISGQRCVRVKVTNATFWGFQVTLNAKDVEFLDCETDLVLGHALSFIPSNVGSPSAQKFSFRARVVNFRSSRRRGGFAITGQLADDVQIIAPVLLGTWQKCTVNVSSSGVMTFVSGITPAAAAGWVDGEPDGIVSDGHSVLIGSGSYVVQSVTSSTVLQLIDANGAPYSGGALSGVPCVIGSPEAISTSCISRWEIVAPLIDRTMDGGIILDLEAVTVDTTKYNGNCEDVNVLGGVITNTGLSGLLFAATAPTGQNNILRNCKAVGTDAHNCYRNGPELPQPGNDSLFRMEGPSVYHSSFVSCRAIDDTSVQGPGSTSAYGFALDNLTRAQGNFITDWLSLNTVTGSIRNPDLAYYPTDLRSQVTDGTANIVRLDPTAVATYDGSGNSSALTPTAVSLYTATANAYFALTGWSSAGVAFIIETGVPVGPVTPPTFYFRKDGGGSGTTHLYFNPGGGSSTWTAIA
jgi:hypothetical protein